MNIYPFSQRREYHSLDAIAQEAFRYVVTRCYSDIVVEANVVPGDVVAFKAALLSMMGRINSTWGPQSVNLAKPTNHMATVVTILSLGDGSRAALEEGRD